MGPDEQSTSKYGMIITPINEDGTYGEPIKCGNLQPISDLQFVIDNNEFLRTFETDVSRYTLLHRKMSRKKFKKWLMKHGFARNIAEIFCQIIGSFHGRISYMSVYLSTPFEPTPHTLHQSITLEIHKLYGLYEGVKEPWMKK